MKNAILVSLLLLAAAGQAQDRLSAGISWQYGLPTGSFRQNFIENGSPRGIQFDLLYQVSPNWRIGGGVGYQDFFQRNPRGVFDLEDGSQLGAVPNQSVQVTPVLAKAVFLPSPEKRLQPYASLGVGANFVQVTQNVGAFQNFADAGFRFAAQGGLGIKYGLGAEKRTFLTAGAVYNHMPFGRFDVANVNHLGFQVGARFTLREDRGGNRSDDRDRNRRRGRYDGSW